MNAMWIIGTPSPGRVRGVSPGGRSRRIGTNGFTLLEVMVAVAIIAIACTAVLGSQSQSVSLASEAKFYTTAALLAQHKMAEIEIKTVEDVVSDSGDFGEDFPGYSWRLDVQDPPSVEPEGVSTQLKQLDLIISWGDVEKYGYRLRYLGFFPPRGG